MRETRFTPGPWHVEFGPIGGWTISDDANGFGLCTRAPWPNRAEESAANANLIAAAPDLYEALYLVWDKVLTECHSKDSYVRQQVEQSLAKARGDWERGER